MYIRTISRLDGRPETGASIIVALFFATAMGLMVASFLRLAFTGYKMSTYGLLSNSALNLAEAGADEAFWALNADDWTGWTESGTYAVKRSSTFDLGSNKTGIYSTVVENYTTSPTVYIEGRVNTPAGDESSKQLKLELTRRSLFANGMVSKNSLLLASGVKLDSYDSSLGPYDVFLNRSDKMSVATPSTADGAINVKNAEIYGYVGTGGGAPTFGSGSMVYGVETPPEILIDPDRVTMDFNADFPDMDPPAMSSPATSLPTEVGGVITIGTTGTPSSPEEYHLSSLSLGGNDILAIEGPVVLKVDNDIRTGGSSKIQISSTGSAAIFVNGNVDFGGGGIINSTQAPSSFVIYSTSTDPTSTIKLTGNSSLYAAVYAPNSTIDLGGSMEAFGSMIGNNIEMSGSGDFHYDEQLASFFDLYTSPAYEMDTWRELVLSSEKIDFDSYFRGCPKNIKIL